MSKSTENREETRPEGVVEKKESGAPGKIIWERLKIKFLQSHCCSERLSSDNWKDTKKCLHINIKIGR